MLLEFIGPDTGRMLSDSWSKHKNDPLRRKTLFHSMARTIISLSRIPQPRIGSFEFHDDCTVTLTGRPSFAATMILENDGAKRSICSGDTYSCTEPFVTDMITLHDNYLHSNESAADDEADCRGQMAIRTLLRTVSHHYIKREWRNGPFLLQLSDFHQSNIIVDDDWNITCLLDLEWLCALPPEALSAPYWLTGCEINDVVDNEEHQNLTEYNTVRQEFMHAFMEEESRQKLAWPLSAIMEEMWQSSGVWFWYCLNSTNAAYYLVGDHLCPRFSTGLSSKIEGSFSYFWQEDINNNINKKLADFDKYEQNLRGLFE